MTHVACPQRNLASHWMRATKTIASAAGSADAVLYRGLDMLNARELMPAVDLFLCRLLRDIILHSVIVPRRVRARVLSNLHMHGCRLRQYGGTL